MMYWILEVNRSSVKYLWTGIVEYAVDARPYRALIANRRMQASCDTVNSDPVRSTQYGSLPLWIRTYRLDVRARTHKTQIETQDTHTRTHSHTDNNEPHGHDARPDRETWLTWWGQDARKKGVANKRGHSVDTQGSSHWVVLQWSSVTRNIQVIYIVAAIRRISLLRNPAFCTESLKDLCLACIASLVRPMTAQRYTNSDNTIVLLRQLNHLIHI